MAVAYFGTGGAKLLPLREGHRLVVDMSIGAVSQGVTNPSEIKKLIKRKVLVFSRSSLHAKVFLFDGILIAGSANVSKRSQTVLDEAGLITTDSAAVRRAQEFLDRISTEPVRSKYLAECIKAYRPPRFKAALERRQGSPRGGAQRASDAKLWLIGGISELPDPSEKDQQSLDRAEFKVRRKAKRKDADEVRWIRYPSDYKFYRQIEIGSWIVVAWTSGDAVVVSAPARVLAKEKWQSETGRRYFLLWYEASSRAEDMPWNEFRRRARPLLPRIKNPSRLTRAVGSQEIADGILRLWTPTGRIAARKKR